MHLSNVIKSSQILCPFLSDSDFIQTKMVGFPYFWCQIEELGEVKYVMPHPPHEARMSIYITFIGPITPYILLLLLLILLIFIIALLVDYTLVICLGKGL